ncbi:unnamed protein product [Didymodactylos carnosus]|uniref:Chromatin assembly factor 1 subunit A dimerization domain-containing protein n=1 Tax=Didymodactylos carnosus TaxID=1234261 RepID=A0A813UER8_9BILA|nr:unnamed protein product [Didymodactylos carnosus]CAF0822433.1 unnamed protein product [Didymodactylos carnosus]CAF3592765.1 unnamed protein product [Didymodactylos carnosus]CAF3608989.1 unnamed protein product [Didymodactylos carnosus]
MISSDSNVNGIQPDSQPVILESSIKTVSTPKVTKKQLKQAERDDRKRAKEEEKRAKEEEKRVKEEEKRAKDEEKRAKEEDKRKKDEEKQKNDQLKAAYRKMIGDEKQAKDAEKLKKMEEKLQKQQKEEKEKRNMEDRLKSFLRKPSIVSQVVQQVAQEQRENNGDDLKDFDECVLKQDQNILCDIIKDIIFSQSKITKDYENSLHKCNSDSIDMKYIHFPRKYFIRPPYYGTFNEGKLILADATAPYATVDNTIDYDDDSVLEWDDGEEAEDCEGSDIDRTSSVGSDVADEDDELFVVPHGHLSDDEVEEDERPATIQLKQGREAAKSSVWDKNIQKKKALRDLKPIFGCVYDNKYLPYQEKLKEIQNECQQYKMIRVSAEKPNSFAQEKMTKVVITPKSQERQVKGSPQFHQDTIPFKSQTKRSSSSKLIVESPSKRRKTNVLKTAVNDSATNEEYLMTINYEENMFKTNVSDKEEQKLKMNILEDTSNSKLLTVESIDCETKHCRTTSTDRDNMDLQYCVNSADQITDGFTQPVSQSPPMVKLLVARRKN